MSRHLLLDRPDRHIILGFDQPLRSLFGQVFKGPFSGRASHAIGGWPARSGLGARPPVSSISQLSNDLSELTEWAKAQIRDEFEREPQAAFHLGRLIGILSWEWDGGFDTPAIPLPECLKGARP